MASQRNGDKSARRRRSLRADQGGFSTLEFALILAAVAIPLYYVFRMALDTLAADYEMTTFLNGWPFP